MEILFTMDENDYSEDMPLVERFGIRGLIRRGNLWAMQHAEGAEYKIPGGGREGEESNLQTLMREVMEETGLTVIPESVRAIGEVLEKRRDAYDPTKRYIAHSYYYFCQVEDSVREAKMTASEIARGYHLDWADLDTIIAANAKAKQERWLVRDTKFLAWLREHLDK